MAAKDLYPGNNSLMGPAVHAGAVTPSDTADLAYASKRLWVGSAGNVELTTVNGETVTYVGVPAGTYLNIRASRVLASGTTAASIIAEY